MSRHASDRAYLESLIDGSGDLLAENTFARLEPLFVKYEADSLMGDLLEHAAAVWGDAVVVHAQAVLDDLNRICAKQVLRSMRAPINLREKS